MQGATIKITTYYQSLLLPTDAQENCFKGSIKIYIKTVPTCFGVITIIREQWPTGDGVQTPLPQNSEGPPKSCQTQPDCENC